MLMSRTGSVTGKTVSPRNNSPAARAGGSDREAFLLGLAAAHDDLDAAIAALSALPHGDALLIRRLKKRKLYLKDMVLGLLSPAMRGAVA
jgi:hypothetical protein